MFELEEGKFGDFQELNLVDKTNGTRLSLLPELGGITNALYFDIRGYTVNVLEGYESPEDAAAINGYRAALLIPFPNRLKDAKYIFEEEDFQVPMNRPQEQHAIHGLFYDKTFNLKDKQLNEENGSLTLSYEYNGSIEGYPFVCETVVRYELGINSMTCHVEIVNKGYHRMPIGIGWHPYFTFGHSIEKCSLSLSAAKQVLVDERMIPVGEKENELVGNRISLKDQYFDTGFVFSEKEGEVSTTLHSSSFEASLELWQEASVYPYLQVYTPKSRRSIAIEPMSCNTDAFNNQNGLQILEPGESISGSFGLRLSLDPS